MELDKFLNSKSISVLQSYYFFWTGSSEIPHSKAQLLRRLRGSMLDKARVAARFDALGEVQKRLIKGILKSEAFRWVPSEVGDDLAQTLDELDAIGFLEVERGGEDRERVSAASLPTDFAALLADAADIDLRPALQLLSLSAFLDGLPEKERTRLVSPWVGGGDIRAAVEHLTRPESMSLRLESLDGKLRDELHEAILRKGGLLPRKGEDQKTVREQLEAALIGTVGTVELAIPGFALRGRYLVVFQEVVDAYCSSVPSPEPGFVRVRGVDFLCDISLLGRACLAGSLRVKRTGEPYAGASRKLQERMLLRGGNEEEDAQFLSWKMAVAAKLGMIETDSEKTRCRLADMRSWEQLSLSEKLRELVDAVAQEPGPAGETLPVEARRLTTAAIAENGLRWASLQATVSRVTARWLLKICDTEPEIWVSTPSAAVDLAQVRGQIGEFIRRSLWLAGLVETSEAAGGCLVRWARWTDAPERTGEKLLLLGPDFELLILGENPPPDLVYAVERLAVRESVDRVWKYRLTSESVKLAVASGMDFETIINFLTDNSRKSLPQNVRYSISDWAGKAYVARGYCAPVFEAESAESLRQAMAVPAFRRLVRKELGDRAACLKEKLSEEVIQKLRDAGIYVDWQDKISIRG